MKPLLVVGAGPVGMTLASELVRYGVPVRIMAGSSRRLRGVFNRERRQNRRVSRGPFSCDRVVAPLSTFWEADAGITDA